MNEYFSRFLDGDYEVGKLYFIESVEDTEWGVDFRIIEASVLDEYEDCLVFRYSNPMSDGEWQIGTFMSLTEAVDVKKEAYQTWVDELEMMSKWE